MNINFSEIVKEAMEHKEKRNVDLARLTGYSSQHISDLLSGKRRWNEDSMNKVCAALEITVRYESPECVVGK